MQGCSGVLSISPIVFILNDEGIFRSRMVINLTQMRPGKEISFTMNKKQIIDIKVNSSILPTKILENDDLINGMRSGANLATVHSLWIFFEIRYEGCSHLRSWQL